MAKVAAKDKGTSDDPWVLKTPPGTSEYKMFRDEAADPPALVCIVGTTKLSYQLRCIDDLHARLKKHGDWRLLASAEGKRVRAIWRRRRFRLGTAPNLRLIPRPTGASRDGHQATPGNNRVPP